MKKNVSVVMPLFNEEKYIVACLESLLNQDYPREDMEWIFVDGGSTDATKKILKEYQSKYEGLIKIYDNPKKIVPYAMNIGIAASEGKYIVRLDAHAEYARDYVSKCVYYLETTDADNVGGVAETKSHGPVGEAIALMLSSKFGVGNSQFRTGGKDGYVDTVPFGAFRREVFSKYGGYDERLVRNQDNEMNFRIRKNGGKIYIANEIKLAYYCRDTVKGISNMAYTNGKWNVITMKMCPGAMGLRHFIPLTFVLSLVALPILTLASSLLATFLGGAVFGILARILLALFSLEMLIYLSLDVLFSAKQARKASDFWRLLYIFPVFHIAYGSGSLFGIKALLGKKYSGPYEAPKI